MNTVFTIAWPSGRAEIDLAAWFPAPDYRVRQLRKLLELDPEAAGEIKRTAEKYIRETRARRQADRDDAVVHTDRYRHAAACNGDLREAKRLIGIANRHANAARRAERDIRQLCRNAAVIQGWRFDR